MDNENIIEMLRRNIKYLLKQQDKSLFLKVIILWEKDFIFKIFQM